MSEHQPETIVTQLEKALLEHLQSVRLLSNWAEFAHDSSCSYFDESDDPFSFSRCNCAKAQVLENLNLNATEGRLLGLVHALKAARPA